MQRRSPEQVEQLVREVAEMYEGGISVADMSEELGTSSAYIYMLLKRAGVDTGGGYGAGILRRLGERTKADLIQDYIDGEKTVMSILAEYSITYTQLYNLLAIAGVPTRKTAYDARVSDKRKDIAVDMYKEGHLLKVITAETGVSQPTLHYELHKRGIPLRQRRGRRTQTPNPEPTRK